MDGDSNGGHKLLGCVHPIAFTQCGGKLLQANLPYFWEPGFVPVSSDTEVNE